MADINMSAKTAAPAGLAERPADGAAPTGAGGEPIWDIIELLFFAYRDFVGDPDEVLLATFLHDIGKVETYSVGAAGFDYTQAGYLLQHIVLGSLMLDRRLRTLPPGTLTEVQELELHHFIQSHHGLPEHGAAVRPVTPAVRLSGAAAPARARAERAG